MKSLKAAWLPFELNTNAALLVILSTVTSSQVCLSSSVRCFVSVHWPSWYYRLLSGCDSTFLDWGICFKTNNKETNKKANKEKPCKPYEFDFKQHIHGASWSARLEMFLLLFFQWCVIPAWLASSHICCGIYRNFGQVFYLCSSKLLVGFNCTSKSRIKSTNYSWWDIGICFWPCIQRVEY